MTHKLYTPLKPTLIWLQIAALLLLLAFPGKAHACSCGFDIMVADPERIQQSMDDPYSPIVFLGEVIEYREKTEEESQRIPGDSIIVTFNVERVYKGEIADQFALTTAIASEICGYNFMVGETYLTFVSGGGGNSFGSGLCSNNQANPSPDLLAILGDGYPPSANETGGVSGSWQSTPEDSIAIFTLGVAGMGLIAYLTATKRRPLKRPQKLL